MRSDAHSPLPVVCITGPTGAGKTAAALALAEALPISVINADSRQIYRDFPITTAQPSSEERARCPHLLYGFLPTQEALGAGSYVRKATAAILEARTQGRLPVLVGGTGLYLAALLKGMAPIPESDPAIRAYWQKRCNEEGSERLHALLSGKDPAYAAKIHPNDRQRITRALEVEQATGKSLSWWHARPLPPPPYAAVRFSVELPLTELEALLQKRIDSMLLAGAEEEIRSALPSCPDLLAPGWSAVGCSELAAYLSGELSLSDCRSLWYKNTRAYAKRQLTWLRSDKELLRLRPERTADLVRHVLQMRTAYQGGRMQTPAGF
jgi:tRNA dimethylallyltransferase